MRIRTIQKSDDTISDTNTDLFCFGHLENSDTHGKLNDADSHFLGSVKKAMDLEKFTGESNKSVLIYGDNSIKRINIFGLGKQEKLNQDKLRVLGAKISTNANNMKCKNISIDAESFKLDKSDNLQVFCEGLVLGSYEFLDYKSKVEKSNTLKTINIHGNIDLMAMKTGQILGDSVAFSRDLGNHPPNILTPTLLAEKAKEITSNAENFTYKCYDVSEFEAMGFGSFYGVARGASTPAKFFIAEYNGGGNEAPFALVGKGLTFDSGGISLKPGARMDEMKFDMCGSATVMGVLMAVAELQPKINIVFAIGSTENMPDGDAQRPGDIVTAYNGKTIEILNTDAEGRLVLADALSYVVDKYNPSGMMDFATLTGAVVVALGDKCSGVMGNDDKLMSEVKSSADNSTEKVWELPLWKEYSKDIESKIADIKNLGKAPMAGTIAAGVFLKEFVGDTPWVHMDIAATAWGPTEPAYQPKNGATGVGVRLVYDLLKNRSK